MDYKGLFKNILGLSLILVFGIYISSCSEDEPPVPELNLVVNGIDGFEVDLATEAKNVTTWSWDYGDGNTSDKVGGHIYTYTERGDFTVTCSVTGDGGQITKTVNVHVATVEELLTAHTWVMSNAGSSNGLGFHITTDLTVDMPAPDILGTLNSLRADGETYDFTAEYDDEYTFNSDNTYTVDYKNGNVLTSWVYSGTDQASIRGTCFFVGIFTLAIDEITSAKWTLHENEDLTLHTVFDESQLATSGGVAETVEFKDVDYLTFEDGGFIGIKDFTSTAVIRGISDDELLISVFFHGYADGTLGGMNEPCFNINLTFKPKN